GRDESDPLARRPRSAASRHRPPLDGRLHEPAAGLLLLCPLLQRQLRGRRDRACALPAPAGHHEPDVAGRTPAPATRGLMALATPRWEAPVASPLLSPLRRTWRWPAMITRSEEHTSELQSPYDLVCRLLLEK